VLVGCTLPDALEYSFAALLNANIHENTQPVNQQIASTLAPDLYTTASIVEPHAKSVLLSILQATELILKQDHH
jgi:hypothetical protein